MKGSHTKDFSRDTERSIWKAKVVGLDIAHRGSQFYGPSCDFI